jgi:hypothetical protein
MSKTEVRNYLDNIRGVRKVRVPGDRTRKWYYLVRKRDIRAVAMAEAAAIGFGDDMASSGNGSVTSE